MRMRLMGLTLLACGLAGVAGAADKWHAVTTQNFTVVSNAGEKQLRRTAIEFEQVRAAYGKVWPQARLSLAKPTFVLALKNEKTMKQWAPKYFEDRGSIDVVSVTSPGVDRDYLLLRTDSRPSDAEVTPNYNLYRAYLQLLLGSSFPRQLPLWLSNGFAQVLGNTMVHEGEILLGRPVPWEIREFLNNPRFPLQAVLDADHGSPMLTDDDKRDRFDAQTYVLVHYLLFGEQGANMAKLSAFQSLWLSGASHEEALAQAFGGVAALEAALPAYADRPILSYAQFPADATLSETQLEARLLEPAEILGLEAAVHVSMERPGDAAEALAEARKADPESPWSYDAEGLLADARNDAESAKAAYARAVALGSSSAYAHYRLAQLSYQADPSPELLAEQRRHLERAIELQSTFANARSFLSDVLVSLEEREAGLASAQRAVELEPSRSYHRVALARALVSLGRLDEARLSARLGMELARSQNEASNAQRLAEYVEERIRREARNAEAEQARSNADACGAGDSAACLALVPEMEGPCEAGDATACAFLGWLYQGNGVPEDPDKAKAYLTKACEAGDEASCAVVGQSP